MWIICKDLILKIGEYMTDQEKIRLSSTSRTMSQLKHIFNYDEVIDVAKIYQLPYFDNFKRVWISNKKSMYPKNAISVYFLAYTTKIPSGVTHLSFVDDFNEPIKNCIPSTVKFLQFGDNFN